MTVAAAQLVDEIAKAGGRLAVRGDKLRVTAPAPLPDEIMGRLREHKPEVVDLLIGGNRWGEDAPLVQWFLHATPPAEPFELHQGVTVINPARWWDSIRTDLIGGPGRGRAYYGALQKDLRRLAELFGGPVDPDRQSGAR